jgi:hypothetical protein
MNLEMTAPRWRCTPITTDSPRHARAQGTDEVLVFATVALTSMASGQLLHRHGWHAVLATAVPLLALAPAASLWPADAVRPSPAAAPARLPRSSRHGNDRWTSSTATAPRAA